MKEEYIIVDDPSNEHNRYFDDLFLKGEEKTTILAR
jgi:hypothetical protein